VWATGITVQNWHLKVRKCLLLAINLGKPIMYLLGSTLFWSKHTSKLKETLWIVVSLVLPIGKDCPNPPAITTDHYNKLHDNNAPGNTNQAHLKSGKWYLSVINMTATEKNVLLLSILIRENNCYNF